MEINEARKLQKKLYKDSESKYKEILTLIFEDKLAYAVIHKSSEGLPVILNKDAAKRVLIDIDLGVDVMLDNRTKEDKEKSNPRRPAGFYFIELIYID